MLPLAAGSRLNKGKPTYLICRTVRSGQRFEYPGNAVVMGDIHPGGEVVASGHVIVMGTLKGVVHAGAEGDENAVVLAFRLQPIQLRIAGYITRAPDNEGDFDSGEPEIARVQDEAIIIDKYHPGTEKRWLTKSLKQEEVEQNG
ncbi:MAG: septum site-determining protein MinC [Clostridia bacterium]|nr:septum site-determining protein MinC [Clostridia bacterium]